MALGDFQSHRHSSTSPLVAKDRLEARRASTLDGSPGKKEGVLAISSIERLIASSGYGTVPAPLVLLSLATQVIVCLLHTRHLHGPSMRIR